MANSKTWPILIHHGQFSNIITNSQTSWPILKHHGQFSNITCRQFTGIMANSQISQPILERSGQFSPTFSQSDDPLATHLVLLIFPHGLDAFFEQMDVAVAI